jgi:hypothetical protein
MVNLHKHICFALFLNIALDRGPAEYYCSLHKAYLKNKREEELHVWSHHAEEAFRIIFEDYDLNRLLLGSLPKQVSLHQRAGLAMPLTRKQRRWLDKGVLDLTAKLTSKQLDWLAKGLGFISTSTRENREDMQLLLHTFEAKTGLRPPNKIGNLLGQMRPRLPNSVVIKKADKGQVVVAMSKQLYQEMLLVHMRQARYEPALDDGSEAFIRATERRLEALQAIALPNDLGSMQTRIKAVLKMALKVARNPTRRRALYVLPKIHKPQVAGLFGTRPIVDGVGHYTEPIDKWAAERLGCYLWRLTYVCTNSQQVLARLKELYQSKHPDDQLLALTFDIKDMYPSLRPSLVLGKLGEFLEREVRLPELKVQWICKLVEIVLTSNIFYARGEWWRQTRGLAMGLSLSPILANITMHMLEKGPMKSIKPALYLRYIDDGLLVDVSGGKLQRAIERLNKLDREAIVLIPNSTTPSSEFVYLDLKINLARDWLESQTYFKSTDSLMMIHRSSQHPRGVFKGILYGQVLRFLRNSSHVAFLASAWISLWKALFKQQYTLDEYASVSYEVLDRCNSMRWPFTRPKLAVDTAAATAAEPPQQWLAVRYNRRFSSWYAWARPLLRARRLRLAFSVNKSIRNRVVHSITE